MQQKEAPIETEITALLQQGDQQAISLLYHHYSAALFGIVNRMIPSRELAEEVLQDAFIKVWNNADKFDPNKGRLFTWLARICRNAAFDKLRTAGFRRSKQTDPLENDVYNRVTLSEEAVIEDSGLKKVISQLDEKKRIVIDLAYFLGYSQSEIAKELNIPLGTVKSRMRVAVNELRTLLNKEILPILFYLGALGL
jgi:RNA polymerase sigma factor (sigma-70 family)